MQDSLRDLERELMLLSRHHILPAAARRRRAPHLDRSAYLLLSRLEAEGPMSIGQLAEAFSLDVSTVNRQTAAMLQAGLAERIPDPDGGLARKLAITPEGTRRVAEYREIVLSHLGDLVGDWSPAEVRTFADMVERLNAGIETRHGQRVWPRPARLPAQ
ncbi:MarR family winged helix-turn-helix transcriptional regulator [Parafrankia elaeagni]|uniref:MarR family winged helix-turn-helix transcriptional regulator n=1 Tax=Parafrankia elaeagni TaxID=222534 RepID=UPI0003613AB9|nr:MarR family transcriptional regulator [Parafrankia elaeagni]